MSSKMHFICFALISFILLGNLSNMAEAQYGLGDICKWFKGHTGWGCDDSFSRSVWRTVNRVNNCNDYCRERLGRNGGYCTGSNNYDTSSWCPAGQTCRCY